ncbi:MAG: type II toxin-antitoxin system VapC family toxin [Verrucomicrobiota bacterium]
MVTAVDSSVLLDVICDDEFADASEHALREASRKGSLILCECVLAEIQPALSGENIREFLKDWNLRFIPSNEESALLAGKYFAQYLLRGGKAHRVLPDFLIGAHAVVHAERLLARDRGYLRDYFKNLRVIAP